MGLEDLELAIRNSWDEKTCWLPSADDWRYMDPAYGQCGVTVLVVQDYFGGKILHCTHKIHFWNKLSDGRKVDFTRSQFSEESKICFDEFSSRNYLLEAQHSIENKRPKAYRLLKGRVETLLNNICLPSNN